MATVSQFSSLEGLLSLGERVDIRPTLLRVLTDLYMQKAVHSHDEEVHYTELALRLIESVDGPTRQVVRTALRTYPAAPRPVLARLDTLAPAPAPTKESEADPPRDGEADPPPATHVSDLSFMPAPTAAELTEQFFAAGPEERRLILLNLHHACPAQPPRGPLPNAATIAHRIETAVLQRNAEETIWQLERALDVGRVTARRVVRDETGEPFLVAAKVIGIPTHVLHRILLFLNPTIGRSVQRVYDLAGLYDEMDPLSAAWLLAIWRDGEIAALNEGTTKADASPARPEPTRPAFVRPVGSTRARNASPPATEPVPAVTHLAGNDARALLAALDTRLRGR
jgi:hypothetical protein